MKLFEKTIEKYTGLLIDNQVRFKQVGKRTLLPKILQRKLEQMEAITSENEGLKLTLAISYGGQQDIVRAVKAMIDDIGKGEIKKSDIDEGKFSSYLSFNHLPKLDLVIRTSGETRLSNFMLWESAYSEIHFTETLWPNFEEQEFIEILQNYSNSERRYGSVEEDFDLKKA